MMTAEKLDSLTYAVRLYKQGDADEAEALVKKYVMSNPNDTRAWMMLAKMTDDNTVKRRSLERVLAKDPYHKQARDMLSVLLDVMPVTTEFGTESRVDELSNQKWSLMNTQAKEEEKSRLVTWLIWGLLIFSTGAIAIVALSLMQG
ncbi:MAG: hypothetical protein SH821_09005 [Phototrophicales bacterium]|nr:hypothetical protein [Phototrophicales bacterium]